MVSLMECGNGRTVRNMSGICMGSGWQNCVKMVIASPTEIKVNGWRMGAENGERERTGEQFRIIQIITDLYN